MPNRTLLLIEDDRDTREVYGGALRLSGYDVMEAADAAEGIRLAREAAPDLVLMDVGLPDMDGWLATDVLKGDPATSGIPVMIVTSHAHEVHRARAERAGCERFVAKPCSPAELRLEVERLLGGAAAGPAQVAVLRAPPSVRADPPESFAASAAARLCVLLDAAEAAERSRAEAERLREDAESARTLSEEVRRGGEVLRIAGEHEREEHREELRSEEGLRMREERLRYEEELRRQDAEDLRARAEDAREAGDHARESSLRDALSEVRAQIEILRELQRTVRGLGEAERG